MLDFSLQMDRAAAQAIVKQAEQERARLVAKHLKAALAWLGGGIAHAVAVFAEAREASRLYSELSRMSDWELADMGISRWEIPAVVTRSMSRSEVQADAANDDSAESLRQAA